MTPNEPPLDPTRPEDNFLDKTEDPQGLKGYLEYQPDSSESDLPGLDDEIPEVASYRPGRNSDYSDDPYSAFSDLGNAPASPYPAASNRPNGHVPGSLNPAMKPKNYLVWTIVTTLLCCLPLGAISLIFSIMTETAWNAGDQHGAYKNAIWAKRWLSINLVVSAISLGVYAFLTLVMSSMG